MIQILIPDNNIEERKYIIDIIFNEFLGLTYTVCTGSTNYEVLLDSGKRLVFKDAFFNHYPSDLEYLKIENIPSAIEFVSNSFMIETDIPIIYGKNSLKRTEGSIECGIDVFASSFFMLTRWEEYVNKTRDIHKRFRATSSLALKNNFLDRPIVNEYVEMIWEMLKSLGFEEKRKEREFELILTHDVDDILLFRSYKDLIRKVGGDIIRRKSFILAFRTFFDYVQVKLGKKNDPYDTFDWLMDESERIGVKSYFFFMAKGKTSFDNRYSSDSEFIQILVEKIKQRGHNIGIHPSYNAYNNNEQFYKEKEELEKNLQTKITFGRQHYLRFEVPATWQIWEENSMDWDSSCGYADKEGFRCGTGDKFTVFNILTREKLNLKERPLIFMEDTFISYSDLNDMPKNVDNIKNKIKKYNGDFVLLWHNSNLSSLKSLYKLSIKI